MTTTRVPGCLIEQQAFVLSSTQRTIIEDLGVQAASTSPKDAASQLQCPDANDDDNPHSEQEETRLTQNTRSTEHVTTPQSNANAMKKPCSSTD
jgi:hypothetical protein